MWLLLLWTLNRESFVMRSERSALLNGHLFLWWDFWNQDVDSVDFIIFSAFYLPPVHHMSVKCAYIRVRGRPSRACWGRVRDVCALRPVSIISLLSGFCGFSLTHFFLTNIELSAALCKMYLWWLWNPRETFAFTIRPYGGTRPKHFLIWWMMKLCQLWRRNEKGGLSPVWMCRQH